MYEIAVLSGDGIGPEVTRQGVKVLSKVAKDGGVEVKLTEGLIAGAAYDAVGSFCPPETVELAKRSTAILFGASGSPGWKNVPPNVNKNALLQLRKALDLYANIRPAWHIPALEEVSPLKPRVLEGIDLLVLRELSSGIYYGRPRDRFEENGSPGARDTMLYLVPQVERIMRTAFKLAQKRRKRVTSVDKANVLESSRLWRETATRIGSEFPDVELSHLYIDVAAMELIRTPSRFDVLVTANLFGDILTDEASVLMGSLGMMPSASLGDDHALYEPIHGSAPDIAGQNKANPLGSILSVAMLFGHSLARPDLEKKIRDAVETTLRSYRTADTAEGELPVLGCEEMGDQVVAAL